MKQEDTAFAPAPFGVNFTGKCRHAGDFTATKQYCAGARPTQKCECCSSCRDLCRANEKTKLGEAIQRQLQDNGCSAPVAIYKQGNQVEELPF